MFIVAYARMASRHISTVYELFMRRLNNVVLWEFIGSYPTRSLAVKRRTMLVVNII
jgi:hypothetical protein